MKNAKKWLAAIAFLLTLALVTPTTMASEGEAVYDVNDLFESLPDLADSIDNVPEDSSQQTEEKPADSSEEPAEEKPVEEKPTEEKPTEENPVEKIPFEGYVQKNVFVRPVKNSSESLGILRVGHLIEGFESGAWLEINYEGKTAYVAKALLGKENPGKDLSGYTTSNLFIRPNPGSSTSLGILPKYSRVEGKQVGAWLQFEYQGKTAYIAASFVGDIQKQEGYLSHSIVVRKNNVDGAEIIGRLYENDYVYGIVRGAWLEIEYKGQTAYIARAFVKEKPEQGRFFTNAPLLIRDLNDNKKGTIIEDSFIVGKVSGAWVHFQKDGETRKVARKFLRVADNSLEGLQYIGDNLFYFTSKGNPARGMVKVSGNYYYFHPDLAYAREGLFEIEGKLRYFWPEMVTDDTVTVGGQAYYFNSSGVGSKVQSGFKEDGFSYANGTLTIYDYYGNVRKSRYVGPDHVYIDLSQQYMWVFRNNKLSISVPIIGGAPGTPTVRGNFYVDGKYRGITLTGPTWASYVDYWVPFYAGEYGIHDASWQYNSDFYRYSNSYQWTGSKGCVNVRPGDMPYVYNSLYTGMPVTVD